MHHESHREPRRQRGPFWTPITPPRGSFFHAESHFGWAGEVAREQGALFWELQVALSLARSRVTQDRHDEARHILTPVYNWFTEGFGTPNLRAAKALLDSLPSSRMRGRS